MDVVVEWRYSVPTVRKVAGYTLPSSRHVGTLGKSFTGSCLYDHIAYWCHRLEVSPGSCSGLPPRSLPSHPGHQRSQFTPIIGTGVPLCSFCSYLHNPEGPGILGGWPLCVEWASFVAKIAPQDSF